MAREEPHPALKRPGAQKPGGNFPDPRRDTSRNRPQQIRTQTFLKRTALPEDDRYEIQIPPLTAAAAASRGGPSPRSPHFSSGSTSSGEAPYLPAWFLLLLLCIITLFVLSFPRYLTIDDDTLQIHCIVELTRIHVEEIETVRRIDRSHFRRMIPLLGSYGFGGYFGYWFHLSDWTICKLYTTERKQLVLIEDIYEDIYIVSCPDPDLLVTLCTVARDRKREEIYRHALAAGKLSPESILPESTAPGNTRAKAAGTREAPPSQKEPFQEEPSGGKGTPPADGAGLPAKEPTQNTNDKR